MKATELLERIERLYRDFLLTAAEVGRFREEFSRLQDKLDRSIGEQHEIRGRLAVLESKASDLQGVRERVSELEARFKATLEAALMKNAHDAIARQTEAFLDRQAQELASGQVRLGHTRATLPEE